MKSWKTSLVGCLIAILVAVQPLIESGSLDYSRIGYAALIAVYGFICKDHDVTGIKL